MEFCDCVNCFLNETRTGVDVSVDNDVFLNFSQSPPDVMDPRLHNYPGEFRNIPDWEKLTKIVFYAIIILIALAGNIVVICVIWREKKLHSTTYYYIVNLAVSDLLVTLSCTWVHLVDDLTEGWVLGAFFCKLNSFAQGKNQARLPVIVLVNMSY